MMDESIIKRMGKNQRGNSHRGYFWAAQAPLVNLVFLGYQPGRNQEVLQALYAISKDIFNRTDMLICDPKRSLYNCSWSGFTKELFILLTVAYFDMPDESLTCVKP
jgi:hypothetical protein